jgi:predicted RecA/RadA family phage recombinase
MAKNRHFANGRKLDLAATDPATPASGDPVLVGQLPGVSLTAERADGTTSIDTQGVYDLSVKGIDDAGNSAVAVGDAIYYVTGDTPKLSKKASGVLYGHALQVVNSGATTTIAVRLVNGGAGTANIGTGAVLFAKAKAFVSTEQTGNGGAQNVAHGLGAVPSAVLIVPTDLAPATTGQYTATEGAHTGTNVVVTVTTGKKYKVFAWA